MEGGDEVFLWLLVIVGDEKLKIYSTRDNLYLVCCSPAIANQLCAFIGSSGNDAVSVFNQLLLHLQAQKGFLLVRVGQLLQASERVEHCYMRNIPASRKVRSSYYREPVMAV